jgi:hypothetical protein
MPDQLRYDMGLSLNEGITPPVPGTGTDFVYSTAKVKAKINVEVPLSLVASNLVLQDTTAVDFSKTDISNILGGNLILQSANMYPLEAVTQVYFLDEHGQCIDSLRFEPLLIPAAAVNPTVHKVTQPYLYKNEVPVSVQKLLNLQKARKAIFKAKFSTKPDHTYVKIFSDYYIDFKLMVDLVYRIEK